MSFCNRDGWRQAAIIALFRVINRYVGNLPPMPGVFSDYPASRLLPHCAPLASVAFEYPSARISPAGVRDDQRPILSFHKRGPDLTRPDDEMPQAA
jgi:hypothetical protein